MLCLTTLDGEIERASGFISIVIGTIWNFSDENFLLSLAKAELRKFSQSQSSLLPGNLHESLLSSEPLNFSSSQDCETFTKAKRLI